jgi:hypothetical protein
MVSAPAAAKDPAVEHAQQHQLLGNGRLERAGTDGGFFENGAGEFLSEEPS